MENTGMTLLIAIISILVNITEIFGVLSINQTFTIILSVLSIIYLIFGIFLRVMEIKNKLKSNKDDTGNMETD